LATVREHACPRQDLRTEAPERSNLRPRALSLNFRASHGFLRPPGGADVVAVLDSILHSRERPIPGLPYSRAEFPENPAFSAICSGVLDSSAPQETGSIVVCRDWTPLFSATVRATHGGAAVTPRRSLPHRGPEGRKAVPGRRVVAPWLFLRIPVAWFTVPRRSGRRSSFAGRRSQNGGQARSPLLPPRRSDRRRSKCR